MKKNLQFVALTLMAMFIFTNLGFAQFAEKSNTKPAQVEFSSKDADLLWGANWQDPATSTSGIVSTLFGGLNDPGPGYVVTADDIIVPEGKVWTITSIWARGFYSVDGDGNPWALADGFGVRIYEDDNDSPGDLVIDYLIEMPGMDATAPQVDFSTPLELTAGKYWVGFYGYFETSSASDEGRWNQYTWNPEPAVESKAKLRDYADLFGMAASGWMILQDDLGIQVTAVDFAVWGTEADENGNGGDDEFAVTFVVDMTDAVAVGGVAFDPDVHHVFVTGSFADWAQPGSEGSVQLDPVVDTKDEEEVVLLEEGFEGDVFPPDGWVMVDEDGDGFVWFEYTAADSPNSGLKSAASASWLSSEGPLTPDNWLITPQLAIDNDSYKLQFYVGAQDPSWPEENYAIMISTTGVDPANFTNVWEETLEDGDWHMRELDLSAYAGEEIYIAFRHYNSTDWFYIKIDDVKVYGTSDNGGNGDEEMFYSVTTMLPAGEIEYKYFLVIDEPTWDLGEKEGTDNRMVTISADVTFNDVWSIFGTFVDNTLTENGLSIFPNPVRNTLYVQNSANINEVRIFDLTGRMVMSQQVNGNEASVNVSEFKQGVYIMQVISANGVASQKFNVVK